MTRSVLMLAALASASACSEARDRETPAANPPELVADLTLADTSEPVSPVEQQVARPAEKPTTNAATTPRPKRRTKAPRPVPAQPPATNDDSAVAQGYAPNAGADSSPAPDTTTAVAPRPATRGVEDSVVTDSTLLARQDSVSPQEIASVPDTATLTPAADSTVGRDTSTVAPRPAQRSTAAAAANTLPIGTEIQVSLDDSINSRHDTAGKTVSAHVMENVTGSGGQTLISAGAPVRLTITKIEPAKNKSAAGGKLAFRVDGVGIGGELKDVQAEVRPVQHELRGRGVTTGDAAKVGVGAAGGAVLGRVIGGNTRGAVIGGVVGAAGGAVVASQTASRDVVVKAKTPVVFVLTAPLVAR